MSRGRHAAPPDHRLIRTAIAGTAATTLATGGLLAITSNPVQPAANHLAPAPCPDKTITIKPAADITYLVQSGDWLSAIAPRFGETWQKVYADNQTLIGADPDLIYPGQVLRMTGTPAVPPSAPAAPLAPPPVARHAAPVDNPLPGGVITERFGAPGERGVDLAAPLGTPIYAAVGGYVKYAGPAHGYGDWIVISSVIDGQSIDFVYGHEFPDGLLVKPGQQVAAGDHIANVGNNGDSTGPHVEFCVWIGGIGGGHPVDPITWLSAHDVHL